MDQGIASFKITFTIDHHSELIRMIFVLAMDLPVKMKRSNFSVVPFVVGEVKMIRQSLLFSGEPAIV